MTASETRDTIRMELEESHSLALDRFQSAFVHGTPEEQTKVFNMVIATDKIISKLEAELGILQ